MSARQIINELFDRAVPYKVTINDRTHFKATFGGYEMHADCTSLDANVWNIVFTGLDAKGKQTYDLTGGGNEFKVFSTVLAALTQFVRERSPTTMFFTAEEPSRQRLYSHMCARLAAKNGYQVIEQKKGGITIFSLTKARQPRT